MGVASTDNSVLVGANEIVELPPRREWTKTDGVVTFKRFTGPQALITELFNELSTSGDPGGDLITERINNKTGELEIRIEEDSGGASGGNTEILNAIWELQTNTVSKPIESRREFDSLNALDSDTSKKRKIEAAARDATANPYPADAVATKLYAYYSNQVLDYLATDLRLTKSVIVSSRSTITAAYTNLNRVQTLASIYPPSALIGALENLPRSDTGTPVGWEWLYLGPQVRQVSRLKYQISFSWHGAERWAQIYGGTWNPESSS